MNIFVYKTGMGNQGKLQSLMNCALALPANHRVMAVLPKMISPVNISLPSLVPFPSILDLLYWTSQ